MPYSALFAKSFDAVIANEGGYAKWPKVDGGQTWFGVTEVWQPAYFARIIAAKTEAARLDIARECYYREYWIPAECGGLPWPLCFRTLDASVLFGVASAVRKFQRALNLRALSRAHATLTVDGIIGPRTQAAAHLAIQAGEARSLEGAFALFVGLGLCAPAVTDVGAGPLTWSQLARLTIPEV